MFSAIETHAVVWFVKKVDILHTQTGHPTTATTTSNFAGTREALPVDCTSHGPVSPHVPEWPQKRRGRRPGTKQWVELEGSNEHLPVVNEPVVADALGLEGVGDELPEMRVARLPQNQRALDGAKHVTLLGPPVGGEGCTSGEREVTESARCCRSALPNMLTRTAQACRWPPFARWCRASVKDLRRRGAGSCSTDACARPWSGG